MCRQFEVPFGLFSRMVFYFCGGMGGHMAGVNGMGF